jgi:2-polyprenyl-3-methyl-5-hydroxy-6-metoxy-1,4-benzoquinol methylase
VIERIIPGTLEWTLFYTEHSQRYEFFASMCEGRRVLDAACGVGYGSSILAEKGANYICGVDVSVEAIDYANVHYSHPAAKFVVADCTNLESLEAKFDIVISLETIEHLQHPEKLIEAAYKVLVDDGVFICSMPNILRHSLAGVENPFHPSEMHLEHLQKLMEKYFFIEASYFQSESPAYKRHLQTIEEVRNAYNNIQRSKLLRLEQSLRTLLRRPALYCRNLISQSLERAVPGDYIIEPLKTIEDWQKTYILVGKKNICHDINS